MTVGIILARGGSKGLRLKNLQKINGVSLVGRCVDTMRAAQVFSEIIVSSDDNRILEDAHLHGAQIHRRSSYNSRASSTSEDAIIEVLNDQGLIDGTVALVQCTTPLLIKDDLLNMHTQFPSNSSTTLFTGYLESVHHWQFNNDKIKPILNSAELRSPRQQDTSKIFVENGAAYFFDIKNFLRKKNRFLDNKLHYIMPKARSIDIDTQYDLDLIRHILHKHD